jgi:hypothetical protein
MKEKDNQQIIISSSWQTGRCIDVRRSGRPKQRFAHG